MSEVLDLPAIDPAMIDAAEQQALAMAVIPPAKLDLTDVALAQFGPWREAVADVTKNIGTLALDLSNQARIDEAKSLRHRLIGQPRAAIRGISKDLKSKLAKVSKAIGAEEEEAVKAYDAAEVPLTLQIDAAQKAIDDAKEAARLAEVSRLAALREAITTTLTEWVDRCKTEGITAERIGRGVAALEDLDPEPEWSEVETFWGSTKAQTLATMRGLQVAAQQREDQARIEAQRLENERIAAEQRAQAEALAAQQRALAEQAAALARQQHEIEAARQRAITPVEPVPTAPTTMGTADTPEASKPEAAPIQRSEEAPAHATFERSPGLAAQSLHPDTTSEAAPLQASDQPTPEADAAPGGTADHFPDAGEMVGDFALRTDAVAAAVCPQAVAGIEAKRIILALPPEDEDDEGGIDADDLHVRCLAFVRRFMALREGKFPSHPKPGHDWFAAMYADGDALLPRLVATTGARG